ncbi:von Willebrand factor A domain-containing protein 5B2 isoform 1 [Cricetulus griseus]|uniref:von Willebrand factor A domain-containing protein 5B2 isoform 1 n=1 Tax=Cricetulus griseus TaxID=10029 RepID=A0A061IBI0_CRIGR|nr:von Willebrand factor A domain-containing protein 5B2 isoform 1 [Cricetulus griseus]
MPRKGRFLGHLVLDLAQAQSTLVLPTGLVAAAGTMTVTLCSSRELPSRPDGVMHVALPTVFTPLAQPGLPGSPRSPGLCDDSPTSCFGVGSPEEEGLTWEQPSAPPDVFSGPAHCPAPYTFSFEMLVTGPCLLAGLESPSHALRADALPHASSAATICVTLAEGHQCDRALEILLHPSEPHQPHLMLEAGSLSSAEYEAQMRARHDFQRLQRRDSDGERQVWFLQRRFHKDILLNPVLVLSFCPDLSSKPGHLSAATRELLFLLDGSCAVHKACGGSVCGHGDAIVLAVKSLPAQTLVNLATFGTSVQPLFPESRSCSDDTVQLICESTETLQAVSGPPNVLAALDWALGQPQHRAHPRQLFLITAASPVAATARQALEFMRWHRGAARCFSFALAPACYQLLHSLSVLSRGQAYFLRPGERLQPKLLVACSSLSGSGNCPGTEPTHTTEPLRTGTVSAELSSPWGVGDSEQSIEALTDPVTDPGPNPSSDTAIWRRIFQSSYIREQYVLTHCSASPEPGPGSTCSSESPGSQGPGSPNGSLPLDPPSQQGCRSLAWVEPAGSRSCPLPVTPPAPFKVGALSAEVLGRRHRAALAGRSLSSPSGRTNPVPGRPRHPSLDAIPDGAGSEPGQQLGQGLDDSGNLLSPAPLDWDMLMEPSFLFKAVPPNGESAPPAEPLPPQAPRCHVVIRALCGEQPMCWEVGIGLEELWEPGDGSQPASVPVREAAWDQALHRLTAASVVRDNEQLALRGRAETTAEQGKLLVDTAQVPRLGTETSERPHTGKLPSSQNGRQHNLAINNPAELSGVSASQDHLTATPLPTAAHSKGHQGGSSAGAWNLDLDDNSKSALGEPISPTGGHHGLPRQPSASSRLSLGRHRRLCSSNKGQASESGSDGSNHDYLPLVRLQEAPGSFRLDEPFCAAVCIPQERLCRASPFAAHRASLSPTSASSPWALLGPGIGQRDSATASCSQSPSSGSEGPGQVDSGRGSDTEVSEGMERQGSSDLRGRSWATAVALAWLEHRCAAAFGEWELTASKADCWLRAQHLPDGLDLTALKAAARGLFLLLRHWDQNLQLHLLCYSPANV